MMNGTYQAIGLTLCILAGCVVMAGCAPSEPADQDDARPADPAIPPPEGGPSVAPSIAEDLLPRLDGYIVDDEVDAGEMEASLDHGAIGYREVRRRRILDEEGFGIGEVTVVMLEPPPENVEAVLRHRFGDAPRTPVEIDDFELVRIGTDPYPVLAWTGPGFVMTFERGASVSDGWLRQFAAESLRAIGVQPGPGARCRTSRSPTWRPACSVRSILTSVLMHARADDGASQWAVLRDPNGVACGIIPVVSAHPLHAYASHDAALRDRALSGRAAAGIPWR